MTNITIRVSCDLTEELEKELLLVVKMIGKLDGVKNTSYFNETLNEENDEV